MLSAPAEIEVAAVVMGARFARPGMLTFTVTRRLCTDSGARHDARPMICAVTCAQVRLFASRATKSRLTVALAKLRVARTVPVAVPRAAESF